MAGLDVPPAGPAEETCIPSVVLEMNHQQTAQKSTLLAVLQFLRENNFKDTEQLLLKEANIKDEDKSHNTSQADLSKALSAYKSESNPSLYSDSYSSLKNFIDSSLDTHKCELFLLLYPVFVHLYLELVFNYHESEALELFDKYHADHTEFYDEYIKHISTITKREHMERNQFVVEMFRTNKFVIKMSRDTHMHLKRFVADSSKFPHLVNALQEHIFIDLHEGAPRSKHQVDLAAGAMAGEARKEANKSKVLLGLLKEPDISIPAEEEEEPDDDKDKPKKKKPRKDPLLTKKAKHDPNAPAPTRIPMPELKDADKSEKINSYKEASRRIKVGPGNVPPICFYTMVNAFGGASSVCYSEDGAMLGAGFQDSVVRVWTLTRQKLRSMKSGDELNEVDKEGEDVLDRMMDDKTASDCKTLCGHSGPIYGLSFSPDKHYLLSSSEDGSVRLWSLLTWTNLVCYKGHNYPVWDVHFSPQGHYFVSGGYDRLARLWSTDHYQPLRLFAGHLADVDCVRIHPNGNYVATGSSDRTVRLWDVLSGACVRIMTGHKGAIHCLCFSPDGRHLASAGIDKCVNLWDLATGILVAQLKGHSGAIYSLAFSREGMALASGGLDNCVKLWDLSLLQDENDNAEGTGSSSVSHSNELTSVPEFASFYTKSTPLLSLHFNRRNILLGSGAYKPWTA